MDAAPSFRADSAAWLATQLAGPFAHLRGQTRQSEQVAQMRGWERALGQAGLAVIAWPRQWGGQDADIPTQLAFAEAYAEAAAPPRLGHLGVELVGPTLLAYGNEDQKRRHLPPIAAGEIIWCQGYSEPNAGSDLANVRTRARLIDGAWRITGQKIWTSMGPFADWIFLLARTEEGSRGAGGLSFFLMDMNQQGITRLPIRQMTGDAEFAEVFFDDAVAAPEDLVGAPGDGWKVAMGLLGFERGASTLVQQMHFQTEFNAVIAAARANGAAQNPMLRQRIADAWIGLNIMRQHALRMLAGGADPSLSDAALTYKLYWSRWHRELGELAMDVLGPAGLIGEAPYHFGPLTNLYLMSRADTIYAGSSQIQRNIIAERGLGLPKEPRGGL